MRFPTRLREKGPAEKGAGVLVKPLVPAVLVAVFFSVLLAGCSLVPDGGLPSGAFIIDHESIALFDDIPAYYRNEVKKALLILPGESHVKAYGYGLELLESADSLYAVDVTWENEEFGTYTTDALRYSRSYLNGSIWADSCGEEEFWTDQAEMADLLQGLETVENGMGTGAADYGEKVYFGFGWCWDMSWQNGPTATRDPVYGTGWAGSTEGGPDGSLAWGLDSGDRSITGNGLSLQDYFDAVDYYNEGAPGITTIYTTGPIDTYLDPENSYQRSLKNQAIRDYVIENGGILLDYADILSFDYTLGAADGGRFEESWTNPDSGTTYTWNGRNPNLATGGDGYEGGEGGCHVSEEACVLLGKAIWVMLALDAGWNPGA